MSLEHHGADQPNGVDKPQCDFYQPTLQHVEGVVEYECGGYHPVHLGDTFASGRYRVVHKLGHGGSSTVWLARDTRPERYVALKILCAEMSDDLCDIKVLDYLSARDSSHIGRQHVGFLNDHFRFEGPNGSHLCLVFEVVGPSVSQLLAKRKQLRGSVARRVSQQLVQGVAYLHSEGVCHGGM